MRYFFHRSDLCFRFFVCFASLVLSQAVWAAPSVAVALKYKPIQPDVDYDTPDASELENCTIKAEKVNGSVAWVVRAANGNLLRQFSDVNNDKKVDTWSYYHNGFEVYRDFDSDFNEKADQCRWFHNAGMRWGIDQNEDGTVDAWKLISAEEASEEVANALRTKDAARFERLLLTASELSQLGLGDEMAKQLASRLKAAPAAFRKLAANKTLGESLEFRDFGGLKPGMVPQGTRGSSKDLLVYENVWAMVRAGEEFEQLQLGTMIKVKGTWKLIDGPALSDPNEVVGGLFFPTESGGAGASLPAVANNGASGEKVQEILAALEKLDQQIVQANSSQKQTLNKRRADLLLQLASASATSQEREQWLRQLADMVSAATQDGSFTGGLDYLAKLTAKLKEEGQSEDLLAHFEFQRMLAEYYGVTLTKADIDHAKAHATWLEDLEAFVEAHPQSDNCAEALRQLASGSEISGENDQAIAWYRQILKDHPQSIHASMAKGAVTRLTSVGRPVRLQGKDINGGIVDLAKLKGKAVVVQYWTATSDVCKADHAVLGNLYKKYGRRGLEIIGVNLDYSRQDLLSYMQGTRLPWPQLYETGGFESRFAKEMGIVTVPLMVLVGPDGNVINDNIQAAEIEEALKKLETRQAQRP